ncbi:phage tail protein [Psychrobacillus sp. FSL K6-1415]|uniref:phage tail protein n=1 Tax=Psychrobacillus sp. FSL K6-1415 TaxID=2921544 RepID=UPI0030FB4A82
MSSLRDVNVAIGMDIADGPLAQLDRKIDDVIRSLMGIDVSAIDNAIDDVGDLADEFGDLEDTINGAADEVGNLDDTNLNNLDNEVKKADKGMGVLKKGVLAVGSALLALGIGAALKDFTTGAIEAAAGAQAMNAQFSSVFGELEKDSTSSLDRIAKETGMLPNRLKSSFTQMAAFAKTTGASTEEALSLSERATLAAADSAAFYDKSIEDVSETMQSFLKGNFENDAALGISATETTRNAAANELYGKSFKKLDEAQKQLTLLKMVEDGNKLSGALGQAAKESDSFENQMGNLKQAWQDFLEKAGTPILDQAVDTLSWLSEILSNIDPGPFMELLSDGVGKIFEMKSVIVDVIGVFQELFSGDGMSASSAMTLYGKLGVPPELVDSIVLFVDQIEQGFELGKTVVTSFVDEVIVPLMPVAQEFIGTAMEFIGNVVSGAMNWFDTLKTIIVGLIENVIIPLMPVASSIIETVFNIISPILRIAGDLFEAISGAAKFMVTEVIIPLLPLAASALEGAWVVMKPILDGIAWAFDGIADSIEWVIKKLGSVTSSMKNFDVGDKIGGAVSWVTDKVPGLSVGLGRVPYDEMPAYLHKDEAVLPKDEADALRNTGILKGDGTDPTLDLDGASYNSASPISSNTSSTTVQAPVQIIVQGSDKPQETARSIREELEGWYSDLGAIFPVVMEG